jgi:hypothetical protein
MSMNLKKLRLCKVTGIIMIFLLLFSCEDVMEYYYGIPMQPEMLDNTEWHKLMNIFGILRPDSASVPMSFVFIEKTYPSKGASDEDQTIKNSDVMIYSYNASAQADSFKLNLYTSPVTDKWNFPRYLSSSLKPVAGQKYSLKCTNIEFPTVTCECYVPFQPKIVSGSLQITTGNISFELESDTLAYLYDIYLYSQGNFISKRLVHKDAGTFVVNWALEVHDTWNYMVIFAYDKNLASYLSTATNSFYSLNAYRPPVTTVDGGYGVFGAMNLLEINLGK